jgi:CubicO group peptidase (beta-lactamase class C family)
MRKRTALALLVVVAIVGCRAEAPSPSESELREAVERYFAPYVDSGDFRGVVLIARGDDVLLQRSFGTAPVDAKFRIASLTKTFTAAAILMLRDEGKLSLDDALSRFVDDYPRGDEITIEHLLAHASGAANPDPLLAFAGEVELADLVADIAGRPLLFEPGSESRYSNAGYNLLAWVIERASGISYEDFLQSRIFEPLGMHDTGNFIGVDRIPGLVTGHTPGPDPARIVETPVPYASAWLGSGSLVSTAGDLLRWARAVGREELFSLDGLGWPYGWGKIETAGHHGIEQTGATIGFVSSLAVFPVDDTYVICLNNVEAGAWIRWNEDLALLAFGGAPETAALPVEVALSAAELERFVGSYRSDDGTMLHARNENGLQLYWEDWPVGKYLTPIGEGRFYPRSDSGTIRFEPEGDGKPDRLVWQFGDGGRVYHRVER